MKITSLSNAPKVNVDLEGYIMHTSSSLEVIHLCLKPGQVIAQHPNASDVVACLIEGEVILDLDEKHILLSIYGVAEIEKGLNRGFTNSGANTARLLILKKT
jgi:quercetin dioxygenase-like cupin family protein